MFDMFCRGDCVGDSGGGVVLQGAACSIMTLGALMPLPFLL